MQVATEKSSTHDTPLQLLLFVDKRPSAREQVRQVRSALKELREECPFELQIIDVTEQPYLAEYFRLIATPALIKIHPDPRQTLAGSNLVKQLTQWWPYWQRSVEQYWKNADRLVQTAETEDGSRPDNPQPSIAKIIQDAEASASERQPSDAAVDTTTNSFGVAIAPSTPEATMASDETQAKLQPNSPSAARLLSYSSEMIRLSDEVFKLRREKEELEHQLQFKDQIIAMLAHDLRNPLTAASIALETLEMGYKQQETGGKRLLTPELTLQLLNHARTQTRAIDRMITDILQAARGTESELQIHPQKLNLGDLCLDVLAHLSDRFKTKSLTIKQDIPSDLPKVLADQERIRQVLVNLLDNAIKYTPMGGSIQLSALHRTSQKIQVSVCDNGPGIPPENQERIFEERFRLQRDEQKDGYGIGLSLCQRIIRAHYGQIWVDSTPNSGDSGSCFHFTLPVFRA